MYRISSDGTISDETNYFGLGTSPALTDVKNAIESRMAEIKESAAKLFATYVKEAQDAGFEAEYLYVEGDPRDKIDGMAKDRAVDYVVMGTRGLSGFRR